MKLPFEGLLKFNNIDMETWRLAGIDFPPFNIPSIILGFLIYLIETEIETLLDSI